MTNADGLPRLEMYDAQGQPRGMMGVNAGGDAMLQIIGPDKKPRVLIKTRPKAAWSTSRTGAARKCSGIRSVATCETASAMVRCTARIGCGDKRVALQRDGQGEVEAAHLPGAFLLGAFAMRGMNRPVRAM